MFTDSIENNLEVIRELLQGVPPSERGVAKKAAMVIEKAVMAIQKDSIGKPAVGLGMAFAIFMIAQRVVAGTQDSDKSAKQSSLIQLLS
jgi:hypothetical protein